MRQLQQGDVLLVSAEVPIGARKVEAHDGRYVLVDGEVTGHAHCVEECPDVEVFECDGVLYLRTAKAVPMTHEEHKAIDVPTGSYEVGRAQEYDYDAEERRNVVD